MIERRLARFYAVSVKADMIVSVRSPGEVDRPLFSTSLTYSVFLRFFWLHKNTSSFVGNELSICTHVLDHRCPRAGTQCTSR